MLNHRRWVIAMVLVTCTTLATIAEAQLRMPFKRRASTASTAQSLELNQANGPWLIMCASFNGERGLQQAIQLTNELRSDHGLDAYVYRHTFDHRTKVQGSGWAIPESEMGLPEQTNWKAKSQNVYEQAAVVVGNFATADDHNAKAVLKGLKTLQPRSMINTDYVESNQSLEQQHRTGGRGPLAAAFMMPNPMVPPELFKARNVDKVVQKTNKGVKYSLLKCPGEYSVRVATFSGKKTWNVTADQIAAKNREYENKKLSGKAEKDTELGLAMYKANVMCRALRKKGVEAYEFHDRGESYVCVGSFDWATHKDKETGKDILNPEVAQVIQQYRGTVRSYKGQTSMMPRTLAAFKDFKDLKFDIQPMPVPVPKLPKKTGRLGGIIGR